jgi:hypothetical protein
MKTRKLTIGFLLPFWVACAASADIVLIEGGKPKATIVTAADAGDVTKRAAEVLQGYLERIGGAKLDIQTEEATVSGARILVGMSKRVRDARIDVPSGFTNQMNEEGYIVRTVGTDLILAGNEHEPYRGTMFAIYDFLESLGCRWYFPGTYGEVIPKRDRVAVGEISKVERPDFRFRNIWYSGWMPVSELDSKNLSTWLERNRMTSLAGISLPGDGTITRLAPAEKYFETNPKIFAVSEKGERMKDMLCLSEADAVRIAVKTITEEFRANPEAITFGFAPPDGHPRCYCDRCKSQVPGFSGKGFGEPSLSDSWFQFANSVAKEVYKEFPDRWLFTNGYANRVLPPEGVGSLSPNLGIQSAMLDTCTLHPIGDAHCWQRQVYQGVLDRWTGTLNCVFVYDYDPGKAIDGMPFPMLHNLQNDFAYFKARNVWGFWTEGNNCWMVTHLNYYVRAKLMWDAGADVRELVRDYCEKFYGGAAKSVEEYIWMLEDAVASTKVHETWGRLMPWPVILTPDVMDALEKKIAQAESSADGESDRLHVRVLRMTHDNMHSFVTMEGAAARGDFAGAVSYADTMLRIREDAAKIDPALLPYTPEWCRFQAGSVEWYKRTYQELSDQSGGAKGDLVAMLPARWEFKRDPQDLGTIYQWYLPGNGKPWDEIDGTCYWEAQGHQDERGWPDTGKAWYRSEIFVPEAAQGRPLRLTFGGVYSAKLWIWVNGMLVDHRVKQDTKTPFDIDVTANIRPGEMNCVSILIDTLMPDRNARGGLHRRAFVWSPKV